jgi:hypothetical protein
MSFKQLAKFTLPITIMILVTLITIRLSGHRHSLGILTIGLLVIDCFAIFLCSILEATKITSTKTYYVCMGIIVLTFIVFILYHQSYDSYHETRRLFWGLNGEVDKIDERMPPV